MRAEAQPPAVDQPWSAVLALHTAIGVGEGKPVEANQALHLISRILEWARDAGKLPEDAPNPAKRLKRRKFPEPPKTERTLSLDDLVKLRQVVDRSRYPFTRAIVWLLLLTGLRKMELLSLAWDRVNLSEELVRRPGIDLPAHTRATCATLARNRGEDLGVIARMLNHRASGPIITQRYLDELPLTRLRDALEHHAAALLSAVGVADAVDARLARVVLRHRPGRARRCDLAQQTHYPFKILTPTRSSPGTRLQGGPDARQHLPTALFSC